MCKNIHIISTYVRNEIKCLLKVSYLITPNEIEEWFSRWYPRSAQSAVIVPVFRKWILGILLWFYTNTERGRQRWAYSEITFVPGGCSSFGLLLALQHFFLFPFPLPPHTLSFSRWSPFLSDQQLLSCQPLIFQSCSIGVPLKHVLVENIISRSLPSTMYNPT